MDSADRLALAQEWHAQGGPVAGANGVGLAHGKLGPGGGKVVDVDGLSVQDGAARNPSTAYRSTRELHRPPDRSVMHREVELFPLPQHDHRIVGFAEPHRAPGDGVEDRLDVGRRAGDDPQDLAGRRLLLQGFGQGTLHIRIGRRWLGAPLWSLEGRPAFPAELHCGEVLVLAPRTRHAGPPSGRGGRRSESWAETNRPGLVWSRTRSYESRLETARHRHFSSVVRCPRRRQARPSLGLRDAVIRSGRRSRSRLTHRRQPAAGGQSGSALTPGPTERLGHRLSWFECVPPITRPTEDISRLRGEPAADPARRLAHHGGTASTRTRTGMTPLDTLPRACAAAYERSMIRPEMVGPRSFTRT